MWQEVRPIMGNNIRTPKTRYFKQGSISYYVQNKQIYYKIKLWNKEGTNQFVFEDGKFENITEAQLIDKVQLQVFKEGSQSFTSVEVEQ